MFSVYVIVFECIIIIFFAAFVRMSSSTLTYIDYFTGSLVLFLGFAMVYAGRKLTSWISLANLLILIAINFQWNLLWFQFWKSCFSGFNVTFTIEPSLLINCISCSLCCLLSFSDFLGKISWNQLLFISLIQSIGFSLNSAVIIYGLKAFDGGGGIQIFFLSGLYSYSMWLLGFRPKEISLKPAYTHHSLVFSIIGLVLIIYGWPYFNAGGALLSQSISVSETLAQMTSCAIINTRLTLSAAVLGGFLYHTSSDKIKLQHFIEAIINGGIIMASSTDVLLNPVAGLVLGCVASAFTVTILKFFQTVYLFEALSGSTFRLFFGFLSGIFVSIIVSTRVGSSLVLAENLMVKGAYSLAALAVTIGVGALFGVGGGLIIRFIPGPAKQDINNDQLLWDIKDESIPLYRSDQIPKDMLNSNRLGNNLIQNSNQIQRVPSFIRPVQMIQKQYSSSRKSDIQRDSSYVPPPKPPLSPSSTKFKSLRKQTSSPISRLITSQLKNRYDSTRPENSMEIQVNRINQLQEQQKQDEDYRVQYRSESSSVKPASQANKNLQYEDGKI